MRPIVSRLKNDFTDMRVIFVADRGLITLRNTPKSSTVNVRLLIEKNLPLIFPR
jgi:hypothetical protein